MKRRRIGKYLLQRRLGGGGHADVFKALDTVEGVHVAVKLPGPALQSPEQIEALKGEIRVVARLDHPNVLPLKNADLINGQLLFVYPLGEHTLADRMQRRLAFDTCLSYAEQLLDGLAHAHSCRVIHCDVKPENMILFPGGVLRLGDFGIAKLGHRTLDASGSGTVGYIAPEQAMGRPSFRSDVFAAGLVIYRMFSGQLPAWPFKWPFPGAAILRRKLPPEAVAFLRRAIAVDHRRRFKDAPTMLAAFRKLLPTIRRHANGQRRRPVRVAREPDWNQVRIKAFLAHHRGTLVLRTSCGRCHGPMAEEMIACPWCGHGHLHREGPSSTFPDTCGRCGRGRKLDWRYCAWCYGGAFPDVATRSYTDKRYATRCLGCKGAMMPFMRYCPWCRCKSRRPSKIKGAGGSCGRCGSDVFPGYWDHCPWCAGALGKAR